MQCGCCGVAIVFFNELGINDIVVEFGLKQVFRRHILQHWTSRSSARRNGTFANRDAGRPGRQNSQFRPKRVVREVQTLQDREPLEPRGRSDRGGCQLRAEAEWMAAVESSQEVHPAQLVVPPLRRRVVGRRDPDSDGD